MKDELMQEKERILDLPFTPQRSTTVDRIDALLDEGNDNPGGLPE